MRSSARQDLRESIVLRAQVGRIAFLALKVQPKEPSVETQEKGGSVARTSEVAKQNGRFRRTKAPGEVVRGIPKVLCDQIDLDFNFNCSLFLITEFQ